MEIQVKTSGHIDRAEKLIAHVEGLVTHALARFQRHITRAEVHLNEQTVHRGPEEKRCMIEAHVEGRPTTAVSHEAPTFEQAVHGATDKLKHALDSVVGRIQAHH